MPIVNIRWNNKATKEEKAELMEYVADTIHETTGTAKRLVYVFINEYDEGNVRNVNCPIVQINWTAQPARNTEAKAAVIRRLCKKLGEYPNVEKDKVVVIITDTPP